MNKIATYLFIIITLLATTINAAWADTDYIVYSFNMVGVYTGIAQGAINKVSQYSQITNSAKTMVGGYLGDKIQAAQEKIELAKEKAENAQERAEKIKERAEKAKEKKEALMAKYNEINSKLSEYKEKAEKAIARGQEIRDQYKTYKNKVTEAVEDFKSLKDEVEEGIDSAKETAESKLKDIKAQVEDKIRTTKESAGGDSMSDLVPEITSNQADAIMSAGIFVNQNNTKKSPSDNLEIVEKAVAVLPQNNISATKIIETAQSIEAKTEEAQSNLGFEEQLINSTAETNANKPIKQEKTLMKTIEVSSKREKFEEKTSDSLIKKQQEGLVLIKEQERGTDK